MLVKCAFDLDVEVRFWIKLLTSQPHLDVFPEPIILGECSCNSGFHEV